MPRDANGNYSLPSGNPVVTGTTITSTWANGTLSDVAAELTDSMSRSGKGGFTDQLKIIDGDQTGPGLAFVNEPTTGLFRSGAADMRVTLLGVDQISFNTTGITMKEKVRWSDYTANPFGLASVENSIGTSNSADSRMVMTDIYGQLRVLTANSQDRVHGAVIGAVGTNAASAETVASFASFNGQDMTQLVLENSAGDSSPQLVIRHNAGAQRSVLEVADGEGVDVLTVNGVLYSNTLFRAYQNNVEEHRLTAIGETLNRSGTFAAFSDSRMKTVTGEASQTDHLALLNDLEWKKGYLNDDPDQRDMLFVIAQDVEQESPGLILEDEKGYKAVRYSVLAMMACNAIKELTSRIEALENAN